VFLAAPSPSAAQAIRSGFIQAGPVLPSAPVPLFLNAPALNSPSLSPLSPSLSPAAVLPSITPSVAVAAAAIAAKSVPVAVAAAVPHITAAHSVARPLPAAIAPISAVLSVKTPELSALYDGSRALPAAVSIDGRESSAPSALAPAARSDLSIREASVPRPSKLKSAASSALSWWRLSGVLLPLAALIHAVPDAFIMSSSAWLSLSALWVGAPAAWQALPAPWRKDHPAAAASAAVIAGAAVGAALALSTGAFSALKRGSPAEKPLLGITGDAASRRLVIEPSRFGSLMLLTAVFERGLGEKDLHASKADSYERAVYFRRSGDFVELVARDLSRRTKPGAQLERALSEISSDATIGKAKILSEDPRTGAVSVDLTSFALQDFFSIKSELEAAYGAEYALDEDLSALSRADAYPGNVELGARQVFSRRSAPEDGEPSTRLADARRVTLSVRLSLAALPAAGYSPRMADSRIGHFATVYEDWNDDRAERPTRSLIHRWRLEKADPSAAASKVKQPVVFWLDSSVPTTYRDSVKRGVLAWNEAFERVGLLGAIEVRDAPEGFDSSDARHTVIRWFMDKDSGYAIGQSRTDPVTGEIYQATLGVSAMHPRSALGAVFQDVGEGDDDEKSAKKSPAHVHDAKCGHAAALAKQAQMSLAVIESRGGMSEADKERFVQDYIMDLTLHEVGHTLGLRHNFLAKTWRTAEELTGEAPLAASVMDYIPANVAPPGAKQGSFWNTKLGPYDFWAIEYAYKPLARETEAAELAKIAARAGEPGHAYATDEDLSGLDPDSTPWYVGSDALEWARGRMATVRGLWKSLETRSAEGTHTANYRAFVQGWRGYLHAARLAASIVGGLGYRRNSGAAAPYTPISGARRRAALALIEESVFADAPFDASADLRRRLDPGRAPTVDDAWPTLGWLPYDELTLWLRQDALARLLDPDLMHLLAESVKMAPEGDEALTPRELIETLTKMIWREVVEPARKRNGKSKPLSISPSRRRLQEAHLNLLILLAYRSAKDEVPEVSALARAHLTRLSELLTEKSERRGWDAATRDHILQSANKIDSADSRYEP
jgi:hypothetical protein